MDRRERLLGLKTVVKMLANIVERFEAKSLDWQVGCKCSSAVKAQFVYQTLHNTLSVLEIPSLTVTILDENIVEVRLLVESTLTDSEQSRNLVVRVCDTESKTSEQQHECPESGTSSETSTEELSKVDDMISAFQRLTDA